MGGLEKDLRKALPSIVLTFVAAVARNLLARGTVRSTIRSQARRVFTGSIEKAYQEIDEVERCADGIMEMLGNRGLCPTSICIDGVPGSGKSTLARSLAKRTGLKRRTLQATDMRGEYPFEKGRIYENTRLVRSQDMEHFDVVIYCDCSIEEAQYRVLARDRNSTLVDVVDFLKMKRIGDVAFDMLDGEEIRFHEPAIRLKLRPTKGFNDIENLRTRLRQRGVEVDGRSKEELLFSYCYGKPQKGVSSYVKLGAYNGEILTAMYTALRKWRIVKHLIT